MLINFRKIHPLLKVINNSLVDLPSPASISFLWNAGSLLGICLGMQIISGLFVSLHYIADSGLAFDSTIHILRDVNKGWLLRLIHVNGASLFFILIYFHISRGIFFSSYITKPFVWFSGVFIFLILMLTAFLGYVLPWGQMSFWGVTVITNIISVIPYVGSSITEWVWGGFSVSSVTLTRFYSFHFLFPFIVAFLILIHLVFLHQTGSSNPLGSKMNLEKISFHPFFSIKDLLGLFLVFLLFLILVLVFPQVLGDPENFNPANPMSTPIHIQPEWYFLFAYAILRSIPNKLGGALALVFSILILIPLTFSKIYFYSFKFNPIKKVLFWFLCFVFMLLTWIGMNPVESPLLEIGQIISIVYFLIYLPLFFCFYIFLFWK